MRWKGQGAGGRGHEGRQGQQGQSELGSGMACGAGDGECEGEHQGKFTPNSALEGEFRSGHGKWSLLYRAPQLLLDRTN